MEGRHHESVLLAEAIGWLQPGRGKVLLDGTIGLGGHSQRWLELSGPDGKVVGFDRDPQAVLEARRVLKDFGDRALIINKNYRDAFEALGAVDVTAVDAVLLDLGVSSMQLDEASRGFSFKANGPLDMRMNPQDTLDAKDLVNEADEKQLADIFWKYGEERMSRRIAKRIVESRRTKKIETTGDLESLVFHSVPTGARYGRIHPATRVFQALRIAVNMELEALQVFMDQVADHVLPGGRVGVISFHSLEDRIVKNSFKKLQTEGVGKILTKKPVMASEEEQALNPRSRSAKMRVFEKNTEEGGV